MYSCLSFSACAFLFSLIAIPPRMITPRACPRRRSRIIAGEIRLPCFAAVSCSLPMLLDQILDQHQTDECLPQSDSIAHESTMILARNADQFVETLLLVIVENGVHLDPFAGPAVNHS